MSVVVIGLNHRTAPLDVLERMTVDGANLGKALHDLTSRDQVSEAVLTLNEGTVYTSLLRLQHEGWIASAWGASENNRKAKFYSITKSGLKQLAKETEDWERIAGVIGRVLRLEGERS